MQSVLRQWLAWFRSIRPIKVLSQRNYGWYAAGNSLSLIGTWMQRIGVGWLAWELTHSAAWLGLIAFADLFPALIAGPIGGVMADRFSKKRIIVICQWGAMLLALALFAGTAMGRINIEGLFVLVLLSGTVVGFNQASRLAFVPSLVTQNDLPTAVALNSIIFNLARFVGPMLAGGIIVSAGIAWVFLLNGISFLFFLTAMLCVKPAPEIQPNGKPPRSLVAAIAEAVVYVRGQSAMTRIFLLLIILSLAVRPFVELLPAFADQIFGRGAMGLALLSSAVGVGAVVGGILMSLQAGSELVFKQTITAAAVVGASILAFALSPTFWGAVCSVTLAGGAMVVTGIGAQTYIQLHTGAAVRGRVMSLYGLIFRSGPALGALAMGLAAESLGLRMPLIIGAGAALIAWLWLRLRVPVP